MKGQAELTVRFELLLVQVLRVDAEDVQTSDHQDFPTFPEEQR